MRRALLVSPRIPVTYWGFQDALRLIDRRASLPPLGLLTLAGSLPPDWELRLVDLDVEELRASDLEWADSVLVTGMLVQLESMLDVISRARSLGRQVVVGGPTATTSPELFAEADVVFRGEVEGRVPELLEAMAAPGPGQRVVSVEPGRFPPMERVPVPRFDLLTLRHYSSMSIQYSRGCPFGCEFCDIVELFGHVPRVKRSGQILAELAELHRLGFRGSIFFVDDNFIGNKRAVRRLLPVMTAWQNAHGRPFDIYTEASVNLAADRPLVAAMVEAGFRAVFVGIESPSADSLEEAGKAQNLRVDLIEAVDSLTRAGLEVMGGFIVGFDHDGPEIFEAQRAFIEASPIPLAMVGLLTAMPGTALWRRLEREGRLRGRPSGDQFGRSNFMPTMGEATLLRGYATLMRDLYAPDAFYRRCAAFVDRAGAIPEAGNEGLGDLRYFLRAVVEVGLRSRRRHHFWRLLLRALRRAPDRLKWAVVHAVQGEHMIRYTQEHVLPRLEQAIREVVAGPSTAPAPAA